MVNASSTSKENNQQDAYWFTFLPLIHKISYFFCSKRLNKNIHTNMQIQIYIKTINILMKIFRLLPLSIQVNYTYGPKNSLTVFTFAFNHNFHLNQLSLQTITAPYSGVSYWYSYLGSYLRRSKIEWGNFWNNFVGKEWL